MPINKILALLDHSLWNEVQTLSTQIKNAEAPLSLQNSLAKLFSIYARYGLQAMGFFRTEMRSPIILYTESVNELSHPDLAASIYNQIRLPRVFHAIFNRDSNQLALPVTLNKEKMLACDVSIDEYGDGSDKPDSDPTLSQTISYLIHNHISPISIRTSWQELINQKRTLKALAQYFNFIEAKLGRSINDAVHIPLNMKNCVRRHIALFFEDSHPISIAKQLLFTQVTQWFLRECPLQAYERDAEDVPKTVKTAQNRVVRKPVNIKRFDTKAFMKKLYSGTPIQELLQTMGQEELYRDWLSTLIEESFPHSELGVPDFPTLQGKLLDATGVIHVWAQEEDQSIYHISLKKINGIKFEGVPVQQVYLLDSAITNLSFRRSGLHNRVSLEFIWDHLPPNLFEEAIFVVRTQTKVIEESVKKRFPRVEDSMQEGRLSPLAQQVCHHILEHIYHCQMDPDGIIREAYLGAIDPRRCDGLYCRDAKMFVAYVGVASGLWSIAKKTLSRINPFSSDTEPIPTLTNLQDRIRKLFFCPRPDPRIHSVVDHLENELGFRNIKGHAIRVLMKLPSCWNIILSRTVEDVTNDKYKGVSGIFKAKFKMIHLTSDLWFGISENKDRTMYSADSTSERHIGLFQKIEGYYLLVYGCNECSCRLHNAEQGLFEYCYSRNPEGKPIVKNWLSNGIRLWQDGRFEVVESAHPRTGRATKGLIISPDKPSRLRASKEISPFLPITFIPNGTIQRIENL